MIKIVAYAITARLTQEASPRRARPILPSLAVSNSNRSFTMLAMPSAPVAVITWCPHLIWHAPHNSPFMNLPLESAYTKQTGVFSSFSGSRSELEFRISFLWSCRAYDFCKQSPNLPQTMYTVDPSQIVHCNKSQANLLNSTVAV